MLYQDLKVFMVELSGLSKDALHIHFGLLLFVAAHLVLRRGVGSLAPWFIVLALALVNETVDALSGTPRLPTQDPLPDHLRDMFNTMLWPTLIMLWGRFMRARPPRT
jgi:hypothetical protein